MLKSIKEYFIGVYVEIKKTAWPSQKELINYTVIVVVSSTLAVALLLIIDLGLTRGVEYIVNR
jgi:preprotein translocase SecE subunit